MISIHFLFDALEVVRIRKINPICLHCPTVIPSHSPFLLPSSRHFVLPSTLSSLPSHPSVRLSFPPSPLYYFSILLPSVALLLPLLLARKTFLQSTKDLTRVLVTRTSWVGFSDVHCYDHYCFMQLHLKPL